MTETDPDFSQIKYLLTQHGAGHFLVCYPCNTFKAGLQSGTVPIMAENPATCWYLISHEGYSTTLTSTGH